MLRALGAIGALAFCFDSYALELSGRLGADNRYFLNDSESQLSAFIEPEFYWQSASGLQNFTLKIFGRYDRLDDERSHIDIREAMWLYVGQSWELRAGIGKVFWGVAESNHLVDIINQTDLVESPDGEQKLGQTMVHYTAIQDWGALDLFLLPGFRERSFPGSEGRLTGPFVVDVDSAVYESEEEENHVDVALRYSHALSVFDIGLSVFSGTSREPKFIAPSIDQPYYDQMIQFGADIQATVGDWLWKFETIYRDDSLESFFAATVGFEYTFVNVGDSGIDVGLLLEHNSDQRQEQPTLLNNDVFFGSRLTFNDMQSTELLLGFTQDLELPKSRLMFIEGSRRLGENFKLTLDARLFEAEDESDPGYYFESEDYSSLTLEWYY